MLILYGREYIKTTIGVTMTFGSIKAIARGLLGGADEAAAAGAKTAEEVEPGILRQAMDSVGQSQFGQGMGKTGEGIMQAGGGIGKAIGGAYSSGVDSIKQALFKSRAKEMFKEQLKEAKTPADEDRILKNIFSDMNYYGAEQQILKQVDQDMQKFFNFSKNVGMVGGGGVAGGMMSR